MKSKLVAALRPWLTVLVAICVPEIFACVLAQSTISLAPTTSPAVGQAGVASISVLASNLPAGSIPPANVTIDLRPQASSAGPAATTAASSVTIIAGSSGRIVFTIPTTIKVSTPSPYLVTVVGTTSDNTSFSSGNQASLTINPSASISSLSPNAAQAGQVLSVAITGSFTNFLQGATQASFGPDISVGGGPAGALGPVTVTTPTQATAQLAIGSSAAIGLRAVSIATGLQQATLPSL
jgi:hypothetical protein